MTPRTTFLVHAQDCAHLLGPTLDSLLNQTVGDWEAVVLDNGSLDNTLQVANDYRERESRVVPLGNVYGPVQIGDAFNGILEQARGLYVCFLEGWDRLRPNFLETLIPLLESHPSHVGAFGKRVLLDPVGKPLKIPQRQVPYHDRVRGVIGDRAVDWEGDVSFPVFAYQNPAPFGTCLALRWVVEQAGGFDPNLDFGWEWDLWARVSLYGTFARTEARVCDSMPPPEVYDRREQQWRVGSRRLREKFEQLECLSETQREIARRCLEAGVFLT